MMSEDNTIKYCPDCQRQIAKDQELCNFCACEHEWVGGEGAYKCGKCGLACIAGTITIRNPTKQFVMFDDYD